MARLAHQYLPKRTRRRHAVRWHVGDTDKATIKGVACKLVHDGADGKIFQSLVDEKVHFAYAPDEFDDLLESQDFDLDPNGLSLAHAEAKLAAGVASTKELRAAEQNAVDLREIAVWKFQELCDEGRASRYEPAVEAIISDIQTYIDDEARKLAKDGIVTSIRLPKAHEFLKWVRAYERKGKLGLVPGRHRCGNRKQRYIAEYPIVVKHARRFMRAERPTRELIYDDLKAEIADLNKERRLKGLPDLRLPHKDYLSQQIARLAPFDVAAGRHLDEHAKRRFHPSRGGVPGLFRPMQRVEADDWETHLHTLTIDCDLWEAISPELQREAEKTRATLSAAICCVTRVLPAVVLSLGPHSVNTVSLLRMCMTDKTPLARAIGCETPYEYRGPPWQFVGDEGTAILNARTNGVCQAAGIEYLCPQIEPPQQRAKIERVFQTLEIRSLLRFSGRAFSNPIVRGKYEAEARACLTVNELAALLLRFIVDIYHNTPHDGLDGKTPRACWLELTKDFAPRASGKPFLRRVFGERYTVTLQAEGIEIFGNWYTSPALQKLYRDLPQRDYTVGVDGEDLGGISVKLENGWLEVVGPACMNGVSAEVWAMAIASLRRETKHIEKMVEPVVLRAIGHAREADENTRKRLTIRYRLKTPEELEALRNSIGPAIRFAADPNPSPAGPVDLFGNGIAVGTKAPALPDQTPTLPPPDPAPETKRGMAKPARVKAARPPKPDPSAAKPTRKWKPKDRS